MTTCACAALVVGFVAAVNLGLPMLAASDLHPSADVLLWTVDAYVLVFACLVIPGGAAGDRFGRKGVLTTGLAVVALGALLSAVAPGVVLLLAGRVVAGIGAAAVLPNTLACLVHATPAERRAGAIAAWAAATGVGGALGNVVGGAALALFGWRALFLAVVPVALALAAAVALVVPASSRTVRPLRPLATALLTLATLALLLAIIEGPELGWGGPVVVGAFVLAALAGGLWARTELAARQPLLDPRLLGIPRLRNAALGMVVCFFGLFALFYVNASYLQYSRGFDVLTTGVGILPVAAAMLSLTPFTPRIAARVGGTATVAAAFALVGGGLLALATVDAGTPYPLYAAGLVAVGAGCALALPHLSTEITQAMPREQAGLAGGLQSTTRELGSALGVAVIGTVMTSAFVHGLPAAVSGAQTVAAALAAAPDAATRAAVLHAFTAAVDTGLGVVGVVTLVAGALLTIRVTQPVRG